MKNTVLIICALLLTGTTTIASADAAAKYCGRDAARLCSGAGQGHGRIFRCLTRKKHHLSPPCRITLEVLTGVFIKHAARVCRTDVRHYCKRVRPGHGRIIQCLRRNYDLLERGCAAVVTKISGKKFRDNVYSGD